MRSEILELVTFIPAWEINLAHQQWPLFSLTYTHSTSLLPLLTKLQNGSNPGGHIGVRMRERETETETERDYLP